MSQDNFIELVKVVANLLEKTYTISDNIERQANEEHLKEISLKVNNFLEILLTIGIDVSASGLN